MHIDHRGTQRGGSERTDARDLQQPLDNGIVFTEERELVIDPLAALLESVDLGEQLEQARMQKNWYHTVAVGQRVAHGLDRALRAHRDADPELAQATTQEVDAGRSSRHPL